MRNKKPIFWLTLAALAGVMLLAHALTSDPATAAPTATGKPYSVSLNSPAAFPVDI